MVSCFTSNDTLPVRDLPVHRGPEPFVLVRSFWGLPMETISSTVAWLSLQSMTSLDRSPTSRFMATPRFREFKSPVSPVVPPGFGGQVRDHPKPAVFASSQREHRVDSRIQGQQGNMDPAGVEQHARLSG
jgi:hypothetical protein